MNWEEAFASGGPWGLLVTVLVGFLTALLRGDVVSRNIYKDMRDERDLYRKSATDLQNQCNELSLEVARMSGELAKAMTTNAPDVGGVRHED